MPIDITLLQSKSIWYVTSKRRTSFLSDSYIYLHLDQMPAVCAIQNGQALSVRNCQNSMIYVLVSLNATN